MIGVLGDRLTGMHQEVRKSGSKGMRDVGFEAGMAGESSQIGDDSTPALPAAPLQDPEACPTDCSVGIQCYDIKQNGWCACAACHDRVHDDCALTYPDGQEFQAMTCTLEEHERPYDINCVRDCNANSVPECRPTGVPNPYAFFECPCLDYCQHTYSEGVPTPDFAALSTATSDNPVEVTPLVVNGVTYHENIFDWKVEDSVYEAKKDACEARVAGTKSKRAQCEQISGKTACEDSYQEVNGSIDSQIAFCAWNKDGIKCGHAVDSPTGVQGADQACSYDSYDDETCSNLNAKYTFDPTKANCAGWTATTLDECWEHCEKNDQLGDCANPDCVAAEWHEGVCHLFSACEARSDTVALGLTGVHLRDSSTRVDMRCAIDGSAIYVCPQAIDSTGAEAVAYVRDSF